MDVIHQSTQAQKAVRERTGEPAQLSQSVSSPETKNILTACALLLILSIALFHRALVFVPSDPMDLRLLSSVANASLPFKYLVGDWGEAPYETGNYGLYRPIHPISLWIIYKIFGVRAFPNQFINFALHFMNALLLLILIWRIQKDLVLGFMGASLLLVSVHTMSPAIWITDRASLQVGFALLLLMYYLVSVRQAGRTPKTWCVLLLCMVALLSKESGLILPLIAIVESIRLPIPPWARIRSAAVWIGVIGLYFLGRVLMFGANATAYSKGGYLLGLWPYDRVVDLPAHLRTLSLLDNAAKNTLEMFVPIFSNEGGVSVATVTVWLGLLATVCLLALTLREKLTTLQKDCLWIILLNAALHHQVFRYRVLYAAHIALCLFVASSPALHEVRRKTVAVAAACLLLLVSTLKVDEYVQSQYLIRFNELNLHSLANTMQSFPGKRIKPELAQQIIDKYRAHD